MRYKHVVIQQKDYEHWRNDREVHKSANPRKEHRNLIVVKTIKYQLKSKNTRSLNVCNAKHETDRNCGADDRNMQKAFFQTLSIATAFQRLIFMPWSGKSFLV